MSKDLTVENVKETLRTDPEKVCEANTGSLGEGQRGIKVVTDGRLNLSIKNCLNEGWVIGAVGLDNGYFILVNADVTTEEREVTKTVEETVIKREDAP